MNYLQAYPDASETLNVNDSIPIANDNTHYDDNNQNWLPPVTASQQPHQTRQPPPQTDFQFQYHTQQQDPGRTQSVYNHQPHTYTVPKTKPACPTCNVGREFFTLRQELTNTVYCSHCRQPFHTCPLHETPIQGVGYRRDSDMGHKCQCVNGQSFLNTDNWNLCFK